MLKFNTRDQGIFFSSDWHLSHSKPFIWQDRGFSSVEEYADSIIAKCNERVKPNDTLFFLGDFTLNCNRAQFDSYLDRINCLNIQFIFGNHNSPSNTVYKEQVKAQYDDENIEVYPIRYKNLIFRGHYLEAVVNKQHMCMFHYPVGSFNGQSHGSWGLFGHTHGQYEPTKTLNKVGKCLDVGVDQWPNLLSFEELADVMLWKVKGSEGHH